MVGYTDHLSALGGGGTLKKMRMFDVELIQYGVVFFSAGRCSSSTLKKEAHC